MPAPSGGPDRARHPRPRIQPGMRMFRAVSVDRRFITLTVSPSCTFRGGLAVPYRTPGVQNETDATEPCRASCVAQESIMAKPHTQNADLKQVLTSSRRQVNADV